MGNASWTTVAVISTVGGTGLCSYGVRGVDGSRAEHLTVESCRSLSVNFFSFFLFQWRSQGERGHAPPRNWVHKKIPQENSWLRRWAKYTKLRMVCQPNILNNTVPTLSHLRDYLIIKFWFLFINRCLHPLLCYQYAETILFPLKSIRYFSIMHNMFLLSQTNSNLLSITKHWMNLVESIVA